TVAAGDGQEPAFQEIALVGREREPRPLFQKLAQILEIKRTHPPSPLNRLTIFGPIASSGSTSDGTPACTTAPGMPHTTLVASSWVIMVPPAAAIVRAPSVPSCPIPVSTTAR